MSEALLAYLADNVVGGTALAALALVACAVPAVRARASLVFAIWVVVIARFLIPGLIPIELPLSIAPEPIAATSHAAPAWVDAPAAARSPAWQLWLAGLWLAGAGTLAAFALGGWLRLRSRIASLALAPVAVHQRARAIAAQLGVGRPIMVRVDPGRGPYAAGVLAPVVVVPPELAGDELDDVLAHEIAHHRRLDPVIAMAVRLAQIAFFFWPVVWLASRRLAAARERATDRVAVERCARDRRRYARTLVRMTLRARTAAALAMAPEAHSDGSQLRHRIDELLSGARSGVGRAGAALLAGLVGLGLFAATAATAAPAPQAIECTVGPGIGARILASHPDADRDGDGVLSRDEICEHQRRMQRRLVDAAVRADLLSDGEVSLSAAQLGALVDVAPMASVDVETADAGGAICREAEIANRCVEEKVLIDVSAE